jgi:hypothetical protein
MRDCFGNIYPDIEQLEFGSTIRGKVFGIAVTTLGPGHRNRKLEVSQDEWDDCRRCAEFRNCLDFSNAKLNMQQVLAAA